MIGEKEIGLVLTDFTTIFSHFENLGREAAIKQMNGGPCAVVASICAYVIVTKFKLVGVTIHDNPFHIWIGFDRKDFDTIFPGGYRQPVAKEWELKKEGYKEEYNETPAGSEVNKCYWDWGFVMMYKAMCERWGIAEPSYLGSYVVGAERMTTTQETKQRKKDMEGRYLAGLKIPLATSVKNTGLVPKQLGE